MLKDAEAFANNSASFIKIPSSDWQIPRLLGLDLLQALTNSQERFEGSPERRLSVGRDWTKA